MKESVGSMPNVKSPNSNAGAWKQIDLQNRFSPRELELVFRRKQVINLRLHAVINVQEILHLNCIIFEHQFEVILVFAGTLLTPLDALSVGVDQACWMEFVRR